MSKTLNEIFFGETDFQPTTPWEFYYAKLEDILTEREFELYLESISEIDIDELNKWVSKFKDGWMTKEELRGKFDY